MKLKPRGANRSSFGKILTTQKPVFSLWKRDCDSTSEIGKSQAYKIWSFGNLTTHMWIWEKFSLCVTCTWACVRRENNPMYIWKKWNLRILNMGMLHIIIEMIVLPLEENN